MVCDRFCVTEYVLHLVQMSAIPIAIVKQWDINKGTGLREKRFGCNIPEQCDNVRLQNGIVRLHRGIVDLKCGVVNGQKGG
jgi:hypothetical protein